MCKLLFEGISDRICKTCSGCMSSRRIALTIMPIVPWTLNPIRSATRRALASSVKNSAPGFFSIMVKSFYFSSIKRKYFAHCAKEVTFRIFLRRSHKMNIRLLESAWSMMLYFLPNSVTQNNFLKIAEQIKTVQLIKMYDRACITYCFNVRFTHSHEGPIPHRPRWIFPSAPVGVNQEIGE